MGAGFLAAVRRGRAADFAPAEHAIPGWSGRGRRREYRVEFGGGAQLQFHTLIAWARVVIVRRSVCPPVVKSAPGAVASAAARRSAAALRWLLVAGGLAAGGGLFVRDLPGSDRAGGGPRPPACRVLHRPLGDVR